MGTWRRTEAHVVFISLKIDSLDGAEPATSGFISDMWKSSFLHWMSDQRKGLPRALWDCFPDDTLKGLYVREN